MKLKQTAKQILSRFSPGKVAMFHIGRCGSTVLTNMLGQHSRVFWDGEIYETGVLSEWRQQSGGRDVPGALGRSPVTLLEERIVAAAHRYYGFEVKPFHLRLMQVTLQDYIDALIELGVSHFVLLDRANRLRKIVSSLCAREAGKYHLVRGRQPEMRPVRIDPACIDIDWTTQPLLAALQQYDRDVTALETALAPHRTLSLVYESDIEPDPGIGYSRLADFLGLEQRGAIARFSQTNPFPLRSLIANYEEVANALAGTRYEWMLETNQAPAFMPDTQFRS